MESEVNAEASLALKLPVEEVLLLPLSPINPTELLFSCIGAECGELLALETGVAK